MEGPIILSATRLGNLLLEAQILGLDGMAIDNLGNLGDLLDDAGRPEEARIARQAWFRRGMEQRR